MRLRIKVLSLAVLLLQGGFFMASEAQAQRGPVSIPAGKMPLSPGNYEEAKTALESFRRYRLAGDTALRFRLEHKPKSSFFGPKVEAKTYHGDMYMTWRGDGPRSVVVFYDSPDRKNAVQAFLVQNGAHPELWRWTPAGGVKPVDAAGLMAPVSEGLDFTAFDLQMPFLHWSDAAYEGRKIEGRHAHVFRMAPPESFKALNPGVGAVRLFLDDQFSAVSSFELLDAKMGVTKSCTVDSLQKVDEQYFVRRVEYRDHGKGSRTVFSVDAAATRMTMPASFFESGSLPGVQKGAVPAVEFKSLD